MRRLALVAALAAALPLLARCGTGGGPPVATEDLVRIVTTALPEAATGRPYAAVVEATGPHRPLVWRVTGGRLPAGLQLDASTGALDGWPRVPGRCTFEVEVRDGEDRDLARDTTFAGDRRAFTLDVARGPLALLPAEPPRAQFRAAYHHALEAVGGTPPYAASLAAGALPAGLRLSVDGLVLGRVEAPAGRHAFVVRVADATGATAEAPMEIVVVVPPLGLGLAPLGDAALGAPYDRTPALSPRGGGAPYAWRVRPDAGAFPPGLALEEATGRVAGTPTRAGTFPFRLEVTDAAGQTCGADVRLRVNPGPVLEGIDPAARPRDGRPIVLTGQAFQPGMTVSFGGSPPVPVLWESAARATVAVPAGLPLRGLVDVRVTNPDGGRHDLPRAFRFPYEVVEFVDVGVRGTGLSSSRGLAAGDTDGDGRDDVVHVGSAGIEILRPPPDAAGVWTTVVVRASGSYNDVRVADVDRDGDLDVVATRSGTTETLETYRNDGTGRFPSTASWSGTCRKPATHFPHALAVGDVDGDGVPDVAFTSGSGNQSWLWVWRGLGDGSFAPLHEAAGSLHDGSAGCFAPNAVALADLDGDGRDDLLVTDAFPAACAPGEACPTTDGQANPWPGRPDVVAWRALSREDGSPGPWTSVRVPATAARLDGDNLGLAVLDADGDGDLDAVVAGGLRDQRGMGAAWLENDGRGGLSVRLVRPSGVDRRAAAALDADQDGVGDVWVVGGDGRKGSQGAMGWSVAEVFLGGRGDPFLAWATGPEASEGIPGANPGRVAVGDFDGDGRPDVAVDQSFHAKERFANDQGDGLVEGVRVYLNRSR